MMYSHQFMNMTERFPYIEAQDYTNFNNIV
jgi:hypothetical protein